MVDISAQGEAANPIQTRYTYRDLIQFENPQAYSSIGKMLLSIRATEPAYSFGSASRDKQQKVFQSKEMSKTQYLGIVKPLAPANQPRFREANTRTQILCPWN